MSLWLRRGAISATGTSVDGSTTELQACASGRTHSPPTNMRSRRPALLRCSMTEEFTKSVLWIGRQAWLMPSMKAWPRMLGNAVGYVTMGLRSGLSMSKSLGCVPLAPVLQSRSWTKQAAVVQVATADPAVMHASETLTSARIRPSPAPGQPPPAPTVPGSRTPAAPVGRQAVRRGAPTRLAPRRCDRRVAPTLPQPRTRGDRASHAGHWPGRRMPPRTRRSPPKYHGRRSARVHAAVPGSVRPSTRSCRSDRCAPACLPRGHTGGRRS